MKYTIENIAGGNAKTFAWNKAKGITLAAIRHAAACSACGGPSFGGPVGEAARLQYEEIYRQYLDGEASPEVEAIFSR